MRRNDPQVIKAKAVYLEDNGLHDEARQVLRKSFQDSGNPELLDTWLSFDENLFQAVKNKQTKRSITEWTPSSEEAHWVQKWLVPGSRVGAAGASISSTTGIVVGAMLRENDRKRMINREKARPVQIEDVRRINTNIQIYETIKASQKELAVLISQFIVSDGASAANGIVLKHRQTSFAQNVARSRCDYCSYDVVSPYLARTMQLLFIADNENPFAVSHSAERLKEAGRVLACGVGTSQGILLETQEEVRMQFLNVWNVFKAMAGNAELEEIKVLQTLGESLAIERRLGASKWWEQ